MINRPSHNKSYRQGFTLIEILIVVVILGILASVVLGQFGNAADDAARSTFVTNGKTFVESAMRFQLDTGQFLEDSSCGDLPNGFEDYVQAERWEVVTPIGGLWDAEFNDTGVTSAIGVHFHGGAGATRDDAYMAQIDAVVDDGDLAAGGFRKIGGGRYYFIIAD